MTRAGRSEFSYEQGSVQTGKETRIARIRVTRREQTHRPHHLTQRKFLRGVPYELGTMKENLSLKRALQTGLCVISLMAGLCSGRSAEPATTPKPVKPAQPPAAEPKKTKPKKVLSGAELYAIHCNRCHPERYAPERTEAQWKTILTHMRVRANLPAEQARAIMKFLQEDSGK